MIRSKRLAIEKAKRDDQNPAFFGTSRSLAPFSTLMQRDELSVYNSWSWVCIDKIAEAIVGLDSTVTTTVGRSRTEREEVESDHWLASLIDNPNPEIEPVTLWSLAARWFLINGNAYIYAPTYGEKLPQELWVLPSNRVSVVPGKSKLIDGYIYYHDGKPFGIPAEEMIHWKFLDAHSNADLSFRVGVSPINRTMRAVEVDINNQEFLARYFRNDALPAFVILAPDHTTEFQFEAFKRQWNETFMGSGNAGKWGLLDGGKQIQTLQSTGRIEEAGQLDEINRKRVCATWGVSELILTGDFNARATSETVYSEFHRGTVQPKARRLAQAITRFARAYEPDSGLAMEFLPYHYTDPAESRAERELWWKMGVPINRLLAEEGMEPVEGGDQPLVNGFPLNQLASPQPQSGDSEERAIAPDSPTLEKGHTDELHDGWSEKRLYAYWKGYDSVRESSEKRLMKPLVKANELLMEEVLDRIKSKAVVNSITKAPLTGDLFDLEEWEEIYSDLSRPELEQLLFRAARMAMSDIGENYDEYESAFRRRVQRAMKVSTSKITTSVGTKKDELEELLRTNSQATTSELTELITAKFDHYNTSGAKRIAQTTTTYTTNRAQQDAWKTLEKHSPNIKRIQRTWLSQRDSKVRDAHENADGQLEDDSGYFRVGGERIDQPGDGSAENSINCRCITRPRIRRNKRGEG